MLSLFFLEQSNGVLPQFVNGELRSIEDMVGHGANRSEPLPLRSDRFKHRQIGIEWMWSPGLTEPSNQYGIGGFQKPERECKLPVTLQFFKNNRKFAQCLAFANIDDHRGLGRFAFRFTNELVELTEKAQW